MTTAFAFSTDENYVGLTAVALHTLMSHNPGAHAAILADRVSSASRELLLGVAERAGGSAEIADASSPLEEIKSIGAESYVSFSAYARLFLPKLLGRRFDRIVYLDSDTVVTAPLDSLSSFDLGGKPFAIGYDCICNRYKKLIGLSPERPYFNSGVLVIDPARWADRNATERILGYMRDVRHDLMFGDQDYFSLVLADEAAILHPRYNFLTHFQMFQSASDARLAMDIPEKCWYGDSEYAEARRSPAIRHFLGHTLGRPWYRQSLNPLRGLYRRLAAEAGLPHVAEQSRPVEACYRVQWICWKLLPRPLFVRACRAMYRYFFRSAYGV